MTAQPREPNPGGLLEVSAADARARMSELLDLVEDGQFVYLTRHGRRVGVIMPADIGENYERIEDDYWARRAADAEKGELIPWERALVELEGGREA
ncbi:MAG: type II toxin-antitoxin system prevent-host-death family antitoxin [Pseudonocardiaceae bacterium]